MDSLQIAVAAYISEHGSIDTATYLMLADIYTEAGDDKNTSGFSKLREKVFSKLRGSRTQQNKVPDDNDPKLQGSRTQQNKVPDDNGNDVKEKNIRRLCTAVPIMKKSASTLKSIREAIKRSELDNDGDEMECVADAFSAVTSSSSSLNGLPDGHNQDTKGCIKSIKSALNGLSSVLKNNAIMGVISANLKNDLEDAVDSLQKLVNDIQA